jgi:hypothetical protein
MSSALDRTFSVQADVQSLPLLLFRDPQADREIQKLQDHEAHDKPVHQGRNNADQLDHGLIAIAFPQAGRATDILTENTLQSNVEVQIELPWMRTQPHRVDLSPTLVIQPGLNHIRSEYLAVVQERVVLFEGS